MSRIVLDWIAGFVILFLYDNQLDNKSALALSNAASSIRHALKLDDLHRSSSHHNRTELPIFPIPPKLIINGREVVHHPRDLGFHFQKTEISSSSDSAVAGPNDRYFDGGQQAGRTVEELYPVASSSKQESAKQRGIISDLDRHHLTTTLYQRVFKRTSTQIFLGVLAALATLIFALAMIALILKYQYRQQSYIPLL